MTISSLVVTLEDPLAIAGVARVRGVTTLEPVQGRLPIVLEAEDAADARETIERIEAIPGVLHADVVFVEVDSECHRSA